MDKGNINMLHFRYACCLLLSHSEAESGAISRAVAVEFRYSLSYVSWIKSLDMNFTHNKLDWYQLHQHIHYLRSQNDDVNVGMYLLIFKVWWAVRQNAADALHGRHVQHLVSTHNTFW